MSSSFRKCLYGACLVTATASGVAQAQQNYFLPSFESSVEWHGNRDLVVDDNLVEANGVYWARVEALIGRDSLTSSTEFRPWFSYQEIPDRVGSEPLEVGANFRSVTQGENSTFRVAARAMRRDVFTSEYGTAGFDEFDPENTPAGETGIISATGSRTDWTFYPSMTYKLSERSRIEARMDIGQVRYDTNLAFRRVGYDSGTVGATLVFRQSTRLEWLAGPYVSQFETDDGRNETLSYGLQAGAGFAPVEKSYFTAQFRFEQNEIDYTLTAPAAPVATLATASESNVGFEVVGFHQFQLSSVRYSVGRFLEPGTIGSRVKNDAVRLQYTRTISPRVSAFGAVRYNRDDRVEGQLVAFGTGRNERLFGDLSLSWQITPTWYVTGGYRYLQQDLVTVPGSAVDHSAYISVGYRALDPRPRRIQ
jgi:hypothetical protein